MNNRKSIFLIILIALLFFIIWVIEPISLNPFKTITPNYTKSKINFTCDVDYGEKIKEKADSIVDYALSNKDFVGVSVGIYKLGCGTWLGSAGYSNKKQQLRPDKNTLFRIASISKPMTAVAIMQLYQAKKLDLDKPIQTYLPEFPQKKEGEITIRQLLTHTSGVQHYKSTLQAISYKYYPNMVAAIEKFKDWELSFSPGTNYLYTTYGYTILGAIIEKITGESYQDYMLKQVWMPAGMGNTNIEDSHQTYSNQANLYIKLKDLFIKSPNTDLSIKYAGGGIQSTAEDLLIFGKSLLEHQLVDSTTFALMLSPTPLKDWVSIYGFGWFVFNHKKYGRTIEHGGAQSGTSTYLKIFPEEGVVIAILANNLGSGKYLKFITTELAKLALDTNMVNESVKIIRKQKKEVIDRYLGVYHYKEGVIEITRESDQLYLQKSPFPKVAFHPISENEFFCSYFDGQLKFKGNEKNEVETMEYTYEGIKEIWQFISRNPPSSKENK